MVKMSVCLTQLSDFSDITMFLEWVVSHQVGSFPLHTEPTSLNNGHFYSSIRIAAALDKPNLPSVVDPFSNVFPSVFILSITYMNLSSRRLSSTTSFTCCISSCSITSSVTQSLWSVSPDIAFVIRNLKFNLSTSYAEVWNSVFQACLLLSLESFYPPAHQLSLDMLKVTDISEFFKLHKSLSLFLAFIWTFLFLATFNCKWWNSRSSSFQTPSVSCLKVYPGHWWPWQHFCTKIFRCCKADWRQHALLYHIPVFWAAKPAFAREP